MITWDELNGIETGGNYGWPEVEDLAVGDIYTSSTHKLTTEEIVEYAIQFDP